MRGRGDGESWWWAFSAGRLRRLHGSAKSGDLGLSYIVCLLWATLAVLLTSFNDLPLSLSYVQTTLKLLAHGGVLGMEAGGQAGEAHVL